jgi:hypothetical protein
MIDTPNIRMRSATSGPAMDVNVAWKGPRPKLPKLATTTWATKTAATARSRSTARNRVRLTFTTFFTRKFRLSVTWCVRFIPFMIVPMMPDPPHRAAIAPMERRSARWVVITCCTGPARMAAACSGIVSRIRSTTVKAISSLPKNPARATMKRMKGNSAKRKR